MKEKVTLEGRSLLFNVGFIVLNLAGLTFLVLGYHDNFVESSTLFLFLGLMLMILSIGGLIVFQGRLMMSSVARVLVGGLFIVSGLVKANDPMGFAYKLEEYFEDGALAYRIKEWFGAPGFSLEFFIEWALFLSVLICIAEIVLGVLAIIGGKIKMVSYLMMLMMLFFTFLTWHTANCDGTVKFVDRDTYAMTDPIAKIKIEEAKTNKDLKIVSKNSKEVVVDEKKLPQCVDDCGCFGDAMKGSVGRSLTPKESLWKDIVLTYLVFWIFIAQWKIKPNTRKENLVYLSTSTLVVMFFSWVFGWYFPILFAIVAVLGALWILKSGGKIFGNHWGSALIVAVLCIIVEMFVMSYAPMKDYRPYAVGSDLREKMNDGITGEFEYYYFLTDLETNEKKRVEMSTITQEMWSDTKKWKAEYDTIECVVEPKNPSIMDFNPLIAVDEMTDYEKESPMIKSILDTSTTTVLKILALEYNSEMDTPIEEYMPEMFPEEEYKILDTLVQLNPALTEIQIKESILDQEQVVMLVSKNLGEANWGGIDRIKEIHQACKEKGIPFILVCNASREDINKFRKKHKFDVPTFVMDEIELKVISRSNPAMLVLEKGVVKGKYPHRSIPSADTFKSSHIK
jgi:uncharacterized membrane protein YphA (DoxX/SURF4 family)